MEIVLAILSFIIACLIGYILRGYKNDASCQTEPDVYTLAMSETPNLMSHRDECWYKLMQQSLRHQKKELFCTRPHLYSFIPKSVSRPIYDECLFRWVARIMPDLIKHPALQKVDWIDLLCEQENSDDEN